MSRRIVRNGRGNRVGMLESLESRMLMTAAPVAADLNGGWYGRRVGVAAARNQYDTSRPPLEQRVGLSGG